MTLEIPIPAPAPTTHELKGDFINSILAEREKRLLRLAKKARSALANDNLIAVETLLNVIVDEFEDTSEKCENVRFQWDGHEYKCNLPGERSGLYKLIEPVAPFGAVV